MKQQLALNARVSDSGGGRHVCKDPGGRARPGGE